MENPLVSIIIPYYNGQEFIDATLESLFAQDYSSIEIILVNDGSSSDSRAVLEKYHGRVTIIDQENRGIAAARNTGIKNAHGEIIGLIDQDDLWPTNHISLMVPFLQTSGSHDFVRGHTEAFEILPDGTRHSSDPQLLPVLVGCALYKKIVFDQIGFFDETMREGDDFDFNVRLQEPTLPWKEITDVTLYYRKHGNNHSITNDRFVHHGLILAAKKQLERMRAKKS